MKKNMWLLLLLLFIIDDDVVVVVVIGKKAMTGTVDVDAVTRMLHSFTWMLMC